MAAVTLRGVVKRWGDFVAVKNLDLDVREGEFLVLLGPSGCGKTTTMRMVAGLESASGGDISIDGQRVNDVPARDRDIAMVFQSYGLYPHMSVAENIAYPLRLKRLAEADVRARVGQVAARVHLDEFLHRKPRALSGGQRQRVALARAIVRTPRLFLMDEPLSNLDAILRVSMRAQLKRLHHELATTTIYVTHDQIEAMTLATRVAVMNHGEIVQIGTPEAIHDDPEQLFVAGFIGSPPMNLIPGRLAGGTLTGEGFTLGGLPQGLEGEVIAGIRPDHVSIVDPQGADLVAPVFSVEYTGTASAVTVVLGETQVAALAPRDCRPAFDERVGLRLERERLFLFDRQSGRRLRPPA
ncbi:MAG: ABC transporter ATP-binding protein [Burkholderiales bacterium]|nr:ABC transporter ATP-binding protein [Burkholderiales bacterium]